MIISLVIIVRVPSDDFRPDIADLSSDNDIKLDVSFQ